MLKRPLCVALVIVAFSIWFFQLWDFVPWEKELPIYKGEKKSLQGQVTQIRGRDDESWLILEDIYEEEKKFCDCLYLYQAKESDLFSQIKIGNIIQFYGSIYSFSEPGNPGQFNEKMYYQQSGVDYKVFAQSLTVKNKNYNKLEQNLHEFRNRLYLAIQNGLPKKEAGILAAMILGEKAELSQEIKTLYQENGIAHILAISGLHISLIGAGLFFLLRRFVMPMKLAAICSVMFLICYGMITGFPIATQRAILMMCVMLAARFVGRQYDLLSALSFSALIQLFSNPYVLFQTGFLLSYGTVLGIAVFVKKFELLYSQKNWIWKAVAGSLGVQFVTLPIQLYFYYELPLYSVLANSILLPLFSLLLLSGVLSCGIGLAVSWLARFLFGTVHYILVYYEVICTLIAELPYHMLILGAPDVWQIVLYYTLLVLWILIRKEDKKYVCLLILALGVLFLPMENRTDLQISNLDVGQGDCTCIRYQSKTILIDGGSSDVSEVGKYRISKYLKYHGIRKIDYVFLTHSDSDHINGWEEIFTDSDFMEFQISNVILPGITNPDEGYKKLENLLISRGIPYKKMKQGDFISFGEMELECVHPELTYDWKTENDYSLVLKLRYGDFLGLFTGDLEMTGEESMKAFWEDVDYLKVGHHGSKGSSSPEFLRVLKPEIAVISAGENNRYGHPAKETLARLEEVGSKVYSTAENGAVTVEVGEEVRVRMFKK